jgi:prefoldin subunit 5
MNTKSSVEQELLELTRQIPEFQKVLVSLEKMQNDFSHLLETYQDLTDTVSQNKDLAVNVSRINQELYKVQGSVDSLNKCQTDIRLLQHDIRTIRQIMIALGCILIVMLVLIFKR